MVFRKRQEDPISVCEYFESLLPAEWCFHMQTQEERTYFAWNKTLAAPGGGPLQAVPCLQSTATCLVWTTCVVSSALRSTHTPS